LNGELSKKDKGHSSSPVQCNLGSLHHMSSTSNVYDTGADAASKVKGGDFSNVWWSRLITGSLL